jgi:uncharacterized phage protein (TIGR01671 family)
MPNREIEFRIWDIRLKMFLPINKSDDDFRLYYFINRPEEYAIQQFTGLCDKNNKKIFEGDVIIFMGKWDEEGYVLKPDYLPYVVSWFMGGLQAFLISRNNCMSVFGHNEILGVGHTDSKVIGNIFENPNLLDEITQTV